jgi:hypothetical protein
MEIMEREIHSSVIAQRGRALLQYSEQEIPESVAGFLNLIEENETYLYLLGMILVKEFLAQQRMSSRWPR